MKEYFYSVYGLSVCSEIELKELVEIRKYDICNVQNKIDVNIKYDDMPQHIVKQINENKSCSYDFSESWFYMPEVALYRICNGDSIYIKVLGEKLQEIKTYLLGGAFICLLFQRKTIAIHGGSVVIDDGSIILTGKCGAGKSTLTSAFRKNGYKYLADDLSVIGINIYDEIEVQSAYPQQKLCKDAAIKLGYNVDKLIRIDEERDKFAIPAKNDFNNSPRKLKAIYEISTDNNIEKIKVEEIKGVQKLNAIIENIYESDIAKCFGIDSFIIMILKLAKNIPYYRIIRPQCLFTVDEQINIIRSRSIS